MNKSNPSISDGNSMTVRPSEWWSAHFQANRSRDWTIPWQKKRVLSHATHAKIADSIAEFQRGESSEARTYLAKSELFSDRTGDPGFHKTSILFVREENRHADLLLNFMQLTDLIPRKKNFRDQVFRSLRALSDMGWASRVLIIAELIAQEYYPCLQAATDHPVLKRICDKIIFDEEAHICFQVERIVRLEALLGRIGTTLRDLLQTGLMLGAALVVYRGHHPVLNSQMNLAVFLSRALARNRQAIVAMRTLRRGRAATKGQFAAVGEMTKTAE